MDINATLARRLQMHAHKYESFIIALLVVAIYFSTALAIILSAKTFLIWAFAALVIAIKPKANKMRTIFIKYELRG